MNKWKIFQFLFASQGLNQSLITMVGNLMATSLSALALILISRLLGPVRFGEFSVGFALMQIIQRFNDFGLNASLLKYASKSNDHRQFNAYFSIALKYKLILSGLIIVVGLISTFALAQLLNFSNPMILFLAVSLGLSSVYYEHLLTMLQSLHRFNQAVSINGIQAVSKLIGTFFFFLTKVTSILSVFGWYMLAPFIPFLFLKQLLPGWIKIIDAKKFANEKKQLIEMTRHSAVAFIAAGIIENIDVLFVQAHLTDFETGLFGAISRIAMLFSLVGYSLSNVLNPRVARYQQREHLQKYIIKSWLVVLATLIVMLALFPFSKFIILLTVGPAYMSGVTVLNLLLAASFLTIAVVPFLALFYSFNASWYFSVSGILQLIIVLVGNFYFVPIYGLSASAWTRLVARLALFFFTIITAIIIYYRKYARQQIN